jgi:hypothetical protein
MAHAMTPEFGALLGIAIAAGVSVAVWGYRRGEGLPRCEICGRVQLDPDFCDHDGGAS